MADAASLSDSLKELVKKQSKRGLQMNYKEANSLKGSVESGKGLSIIYLRMNTKNYSKSSACRHKTSLPLALAIARQSGNLTLPKLHN